MAIIPSKADLLLPIRNRSLVSTPGMSGFPQDLLEIMNFKLLFVIRKRLIPDNVSGLWVLWGREHSCYNCNVGHIAYVIVDEKLEISHIDQCQIMAINIIISSKHSMMIIYCKGTGQLNVTATVPLRSSVQFIYLQLASTEIALSFSSISQPRVHQF